MEDKKGDFGWVEDEINEPIRFKNGDKIRLLIQVMKKLILIFWVLTVKRIVQVNLDLILRAK